LSINGRLASAVSAKSSWTGALARSRGGRLEFELEFERPWPPELWPPELWPPELERPPVLGRGAWARPGWLWVERDEADEPVRGAREDRVELCCEGIVLRRLAGHAVREPSPITEQPTTSDHTSNSLAGDAVIHRYMDFTIF
jgi:hypothetical protein